MQGNSNNNNFLQLQISQLCNETTHDKVAPTKQNHICRGKSAIEVIKMREPQSRISHLQPPNVTFVQSRNNKNGLIVIIDNGPQMTPEKWSVLRQGLY